MTSLALTALVSWSLGWLLHWWPRLRPLPRRRISVATSLAGLVFLFAAIRAEGLREAAVTSAVIVGPRAHHTAMASASASLSYYVLTAVCLLLGFGGLAFGESLVRWLVPRPVLSSAAVAWTVTLVRFLLEKSAAPVVVTSALSVTWMAPVAGAYLATGLRDTRAGGRGLLRALAGYAFLARAGVALAGVLATRAALGTHYDVSSLTVVTLALVNGSRTFVPGSAEQILWLTLLPQLVAWPAFTIVAGLLGSLVARALAPTGARVPAPDPRETLLRPGD